MEKNIPALLDPTARTIQVKFQQQYTNKAQPVATEPYTYVTNIAGIAEGDWVVIPYSSGNGERMSIAQVIKVDDGVDIEPNSDIQYRWVMQKLDLGPYTKLMERNRAVTDAVSEAYKESLRNSFASRIMLGMDPDKKDKLVALLNQH